MYQKIETNNYQSIKNQYQVSELLSKIVDSFGYSADDISDFFHPLKQFELDETVFEPLKQAIYRIKDLDQKVFIFGDYDCDGICATTIAVMLMNKLNIQCGFYIPDRIKEGYGLNLARLQQSRQKGYQVLFTVDNGISKIEQINWAKQNQMTVIVTDHHNLAEKPDCDYLLHPDLLAEPYRYLSGAALVYLLAKYLKLDDDKMKILAMLSILSDVMSLKGINLFIVNEGLQLLNEGKYPNLLALDKFEFPLNEDDVSFKIVPKINSIGRLSDLANVNRVVDFLLAQDTKVIADYSRQINQINELRTNMSQKQCQQVVKMLDLSSNFNFVYLDKLHEGLLGLIANRLLTLNGKPTFVLTQADSLIKCSARSNDDGLMNLLAEFKEHFIHFGGHDKACGFSIQQQTLEPLKQFLSKKLKDCDNRIVHYYLPVEYQDLSIENIKEVFSYRPFGQDRKLPLLAFSFNDIKQYRKLKTDNQLKWTLNNGLEIISFANKGYDYYLNKDCLRVIGQLKENRFNHKTSYQIVAEVID
ncbi:MAG: DHH family phosphoesterase [Erysipelotrichaceae bacterium]